MSERQNRWDAESLTLLELKRVVLDAAARFDGSPAGRAQLECVVEATLWLAHGRGAAAVVRGASNRQRTR
jgi:hypothetical protein